MEPLILAMSCRDTIPAEERDLLLGLKVQEVEFDAHQEIVSEGTRPTASMLLVKGFACRAKTLADGKRQITAMHIPGDYVDLHSFLIKQMDQSVISVTPCRFAVCKHSELHRLVKQSDHLARMLWLMTLIDSAVSRESITSMGRRSTLAHMAHFFCELYVRFSVVDMVDGLSYQLPLSQVELGDVLGLSTVHVNRTLRDLRAERVVQWDHHVVRIENWPRLQRVAAFDPTYLSLQKEPR